MSTCSTFGVLSSYTANASEAEILRGNHESLHNGVRVRVAGYINSSLAIKTSATALGTIV